MGFFKNFVRTNRNSSKLIVYLHCNNSLKFIIWTDRHCDGVMNNNFDGNWVEVLTSGSYEGHFGGVRAAMQLRSFCAEAGCGSVPRIFPVPEAQNCLDENGVPVESMKERLEKNLKTTMDQLYWTASALKEYKEKHPPPSFVLPDD